MYSFNQRYLLLATALVAALSVTACGKKKEVGGPGVPAPTQTKSEVQGNLDGELPAPNDESTGYLPAPQPTDSSDSAPVFSPVVSVGSAPKVSDSKPVSSIELNPIPQDYDADDYRGVTRDNLEKRITGGKTSEGLLYTGSSTDDLLVYLRARNEKMGWETRRLNFAAAASVRSAKLTTETWMGQTGNATLVLKLDEGGATKTYVLAGELSPGSAKTLRVVSSGNNAKTTGKQALQGTLKCLDLDDQCENSYARLKIGGNGVPSAIINIIFRQSAADAYFHLPAEYTDSSEYYDIREMVVNSIKQVNSQNRIANVRMNSFEVVNGRAGVDVYIKARNKELLAFSGALLAPEAGTSINVGLSRIGKEESDTLNLLALDSSSLKYQNTIASAKMINNNGLGQVRIALQMRQRGKEGGEKFAVTVMRKIKPIVDLNEESLDIR